MKIKRPNTGVLIGLIAIVINIITVSVYIRQTTIMQTQQHASVWPYIEWRLIYNQDDGFLLKISNNGIGPALIRQSSMKMNGNIIPDLNTLFSNALDTTYFPHLYAEIQNRVIPAGESINMITVKEIYWAERLWASLRENSFEMDICYESIYQEQWISQGLTVIESHCN